MAALSGARTTVAPRTELLALGHAAEQAVLVESGWGMRTSDVGYGRRQILSFVLPGDIVGLDAVVLGHSSSVVSAITSMTCSRVRWDSLEQTIHAHPDLRRALLSMVAEEYALLSDRLASVGRRSAFVRLARLLVELALRIRFVMQDATAQLVLPLTQPMLADAAGLSGVHVNRTFKKLRAARLITARPLAIENLEGLIQAAQIRQGDALHRLIALSRAESAGPSE
ncbi:MAG: Crp/Fnr family transcriptional regulator [Alphaproteobacteria bacterium]|nr:Crp/Fnr family transcriptional regulator [Alphaproteobacteria bacterium]